MSPNTNKKRCLENLTNSTLPELDSRPNLANKPEPSKRKNNSLHSSPEPRTLLNNPTKNSNELLKKKPKLKPLWPMPSRPVDTTTTCFENNTKKNKKPKPNFSDPCPRPTPKSLHGGPNTKPMLFSELKSSRKPKRSLPPSSRRWKNS